METGIRLMYKLQRSGDKDKMTRREVVREHLGREPTSSEANSISGMISRLINRGYVDKEKKNGRVNYYWLTQYGLKRGEELETTEYYCSNCSEFREDAIKRPTCPDCGNPVERKKR